MQQEVAITVMTRCFFRKVHRVGTRQHCGGTQRDWLQEVGDRERTCQKLVFATESSIQPFQNRDETNKTE